MKNVLTYRNETIMLLANVDDGTNRLFINDEEIPSSQWVGSGNYTKTIDGVTISITKIANLSGNIVLKKVTDTSFRLVKKAEALQQSYIGMITTSTTLDSLEKVQEVFGSDTTWIQHSGYVLRGATSGVTPNNNAKDLGNDNATLVSHSHTVNSHKHYVSRQNLAESAGSHHHTLSNYLNFSGNSGSYAMYSTGWAALAATSRITNDAGAHTHYISAHYTDDSAPGTDTQGRSKKNANIPNAKNVYIWERVS